MVGNLHVKTHNVAKLLTNVQVVLMLDQTLNRLIRETKEALDNIDHKTELNIDDGIENVLLEKFDR